MNMSDLIDDLGIDGLDLDSKEAGLGGYNFLPREIGTTKVTPRYLRQVKLHKGGQSLNLKIRVLATDLKEARTGEDYDILFKFDGNNAAASNRDLRHIICAIYGGDPKDTKGNKVNARLVDWIKNGEKLADAEFEFLVKGVAREGEDKNTKEKKTYINAHYDRVQ